MKAFTSNFARKRREFARQTSAMSSMQVALGCAGLALAATLALSLSSESIANRIALQSPGISNNIDHVVTGSVSRETPRGITQRYTVRRSVLQKDPNATCIIYADGTRQGDC